MAETLKVLETRRSCRAYKPQLIEEEKLEKIIKAGTYAATGMGRQSPIIIAVTNKELRDKLSAMNAKIMGKSADFDPFYGAQELLIVLADKSAPTYIYDGTLVMPLYGVVDDPLAVVNAVKRSGLAVAEVLAEDSGMSDLTALMVSALHVNVAVKRVAVLACKEAVARLVVDKLQ